MTGKKNFSMEKLDLEEIEGQFGLMLREKKDHDNYVLIRFETLKKLQPTMIYSKRSIHYETN